jgi:hypothetical protein
MAKWVVTVCVLGLAFGTSVQAASFVGIHSSNGVFITSDVRVGYDDPVFGTSVAADFALASDSDLAANFQPLGTASATALAVPLGGGAAKDQVEGKLKLEYELGSPFSALPLDEGRFEVSGDGSALASKNFAGNPSDAVVDARGRMTFFVDTFLLPLDAVAGQLNLPAMPALQPYETGLSLEVYVDLGAVPDLTLLPGDPATVFEVKAGHQYDLLLDYGVRVPYGDDPPFAFTYSFTAEPAPVPEPATLALLGLGALALSFRQRL